jgi:hypothetical protein
MGCGCVYEQNGMDPSDLEEKHPDIYKNGATEAMYEKFDAVVEAAGGRLPWTGEWPGAVECREYDLWCRWVEIPEGHVCASGTACLGLHGWVVCDKSHPGAREDLNRLAMSCDWDPKARRYVRRRGAR